MIHGDDAESISIQKLQSTSTIFGDLGITEYTVEIFNSLERQLSGELQFPLSDQQTIIGYALDINGELREAVGVDRAKGRAAFENIVSRSIDPGLLEKTEDNNFKTRVYPIPAKGSRTIKLTILDKLIWENGTMRFKLPVHFKEKIAQKDIQINFVGFTDQIQFSKIKSFDINKKNGNISLQSNTVKNFDITITPVQQSFSYYQKIKGQFYYYTTTPVLKNNKTKTLPKNITVLWDHSRSRKGQVDTEIEFLKALAKRLQHVNINIVLFNTQITETKKINIKNGNTKNLERFLNAIPYDAATQYGCITQFPKSDITLLCSDGLSNFGDINFKNSDGILHTITAQASGNPSRLKAIATSHGGAYINLQNKTLDNSISELLEEASLFSGCKENEFTEYYPEQNTRISNARLSIVAKGKHTKTITPTINHKTDTLNPITPIKIDTSIIDLEQLFAIEKINNLSLYPERYRDQITSLGLQYNLLTDYTSLIVLENIEDYIENEIVPPTRKLKQLYFDNLAVAKLEKEEIITEVFWEQNEALNDLLIWRFPEKEEELERVLEAAEKNLEAIEDRIEVKREKLEALLTEKKSLITPKTEAPIIDENYETPSSGDANINITVTQNGDEYLVSGTIRENNEYGLPGVNVFINSGTIGTQTDFDGNFSLTVPINTTLNFSFIGYQGVQQTITPGSHQIDMPEDNAVLEEVVVTGVASNNPKYKNKIDFLENAPNIDDYQVFSYNKELIIKRKNEHIILGESPLVFVDYDDDDFDTLRWEDGQDELKYLDWDDIFSLEIIPQKKAKQLGGDIAKSGIIFVYTKDFVEDDAISIPIVYNKHIIHELSKKVWNNIPKSLLKIKKYKPQKRYQKYLSLVTNQEQPVGFYMAAGSIFKEDAPEIAAKIWSNIAEIQLDNHENMRTLAYLLRSTGYYKEAIPIFEKILALRPDEPIAHRDLAVTYELNKNYTKAAKVLKEALEGSWIERNRDPDDYVEVLNTLYNDYNTIAVKDNNLKKEKYMVTGDLRAVLNWTSSNTDIDLHLITPAGEDFYYSNDESENIRYNTDITQGFGPEEIIVKNAKKGTYKILIDFFADRQQTIHGPVGVSIEIYKYFGTDKEERIEKVLTLTKEQDDILGALIEF